MDIINVHLVHFILLMELICSVMFSSKAFIPRYGNDSKTTHHVETVAKQVLVLESVHIGLAWFIRNCHNMVKNHQKAIV